MTLRPRSAPTFAALAPAPVTLANGVRVLVLPMPHLETASVSVFVRTGSAYESRRLAGVSHFVEHMVFKGTATRDARRINRDAEELGAEVNAHTDKDHTAFHMRGLAEHAGLFVRMLGDIVRHATFPAEDLERERQVLLHELTEDEDDPMSTAFRLFDSACWGAHPAAQPVIGSRRNVEQLTRDDLVAWVGQQYFAERVVVAAAGGVDPDLIVREAEAAFGSMARGSAPELLPPPWQGEIKARPLSGSSQAHVVLGFPLPTLRADDPAPALAASLLGEGMSSPLMDELREQRSLFYYGACSADVLDLCGQFVIEASTAPEHLEAFVEGALRLLSAQAASIAPLELQRARHQSRVRVLRTLENPSRRLEEAVLELFALGRVRPREEALQRIDDVDAETLRRSFATMLAHPIALATTGKVPRGAGQRLRDTLGTAPAGTAA